MKLSFKKQKRETGLRAVGYPNPCTDIKGDGKIIGIIRAPTWQSPDNKWRIALCIHREPTPGHTCPFEWVTLKVTFDDEGSARAYVKEKFSQIETQFKLYQLEYN